MKANKTRMKDQTIEGNKKIKKKKMIKTKKTRKEKNQLPIHLPPPK